MVAVVVDEGATILDDQIIPAFLSVCVKKKKRLICNWRRIHQKENTKKVMAPRPNYEKVVSSSDEDCVQLVKPGQLNKFK